MQPDASILIAAHQAAGFLHHAIGSALAQTLRTIEVVVVDDGSTDGTWRVITDFADRDPRVVALRRPSPGGPGAARNAAIERATGRWLAVLDADDLYLPERLERMVALADSSGADLLATNLRERDFQTGADLGLCFTAGEMAAVDGALTRREVIRRDMPDRPGRRKFGFLKPVIRREFLRANGLRYREEIGSGEDLLLYAECIAAGADFRLTPEAWYIYSFRQGSISSSRAASLHLSRGNRRLLDLAAPLGDPALTATLRRRQRLIDGDCFAHLLELRRLVPALAYAPSAGPRRALRELRIVLGASRRRFSARAAAALGLKVA